MVGILRLVITLFSLVSSLSVTVSVDVSKDVNWWCNKTPYPDVCRHFMDSRRSFTAKKKSEFLKMAVEVAMDRAQHAQSHTKQLKSKCHNRKAKAAWNDCLELYENTILQLNGTMDPNHRSTTVDAQTWLSTALTNLQTCRTGFAELGITDLMLPLANNVSQLISNTLAINKIRSDQRQKSMKDGFPAWVSSGDRRLLLGKSNPRANIVVAQDGSGNFHTIKDALDAANRLRNGRTTRFVIHVKAGIYRENIVIELNMKNIMLRGDGLRKTIITSSRSVRGGYTTFNSATVGVQGGGFIGRDITFRNTAGPQNRQAVALCSSSDFSVFYRCSIEGYQDTLYVHSQRQFYRDCYIYGTIDFIFGNAAVVLQNCMIYARRPIHGQQNSITAQGRMDPNQNTGITIQDSRIMASPDLKPVQRYVRTYLGRPWGKYSRTVLIHTYLDTVVHPAGWMKWDGNYALSTLYYAEYKNLGPAASTAKRVKWPGHRVITSSQALMFTAGHFISGAAWLPATGVPFNHGL